MGSSDCGRFGRLTESRSKFGAALRSHNSNGGAVMRTRAGLIATIAVGLWLSLAAGNNLAANQGSYKPTEADIERQQEMERLEKQMKETEKVLEKFRKQDEDFAKRVAHEDETRSTRKFWGETDLRRPLRRPDAGSSIVQETGTPCSCFSWRPLPRGPSDVVWSRHTPRTPSTFQSSSPWCSCLFCRCICGLTLWAVSSPSGSCWPMTPLCDGKNLSCRSKLRVLVGRSSRSKTSWRERK